MKIKAQVGQPYLHRKKRCETQARLAREEKGGRRASGFGRILAKRPLSDGEVPDGRWVRGVRLLGGRQAGTRRIWRFVW